MKIICIRKRWMGVWQAVQVGVLMAVHTTAAIVAKVTVMAAVEMLAPATVGELVGLVAKINLIKLN